MPRGLEVLGSPATRSCYGLPGARRRTSESGIHAVKKLSTRYKDWLNHRAKREARRALEKKKRFRKGRKKRVYKKIVTAWFGDRIEKMLSVNPPHLPPSVLCLADNTSDTLEFLHRWRSNVAIRTDGPPVEEYHWELPPHRGRKLRRVPMYTDFSVISEMSTSVAIIIAAEYDRAHRLIGTNAPTIDIDQWHDGVFQRLFELGFFEIVGLTENVAELYRDENQIRTMRIITGSNAQDIKHASESLIELSSFIDADGPMSDDLVVALNSALGEAMANVSRHAYQGDIPLEFRSVDAWWITATADRRNRKLTIVFYDQGATIPVTLPRKPLMRTLVDMLRRPLSSQPEFEFQDDAIYIEGAMARGETQTGEPGRGEGLPQMMELVDICGSGSLTIYSRGGMARYRCGQDIEIRSFPHSVGGTLIEWEMEFPGGGGNG